MSKFNFRTNGWSNGNQIMADVLIENHDGKFEKNDGEVICSIDNIDSKPTVWFSEKEMQFDDSKSLLVFLGDLIVKLSDFMMSLKDDENVSRETSEKTEQEKDLERIMDERNFFNPDNVPSINVLVDAAAKQISADTFMIAPPVVSNGRSQTPEDFFSAAGTQTVFGSLDKLTENVRKSFEIFTPIMSIESRKELLTFSEALELMKKGHKIKRKSKHSSFSTINNLYITQFYDGVEQTMTNMFYVEDMLADDWEVVE